MKDSTVAHNQLWHVIDVGTPAEVDTDNLQLRPLRLRTLPCPWYPVTSDTNLLLLYSYLHQHLRSITRKVNTAKTHACHFTGLKKTCLNFSPHNSPPISFSVCQVDVYSDHYTCKRARTHTHKDFCMHYSSLRSPYLSLSFKYWRPA
jgi:hypothetical protein